jgi:5-methylcytosine-specific restriction endonuclease McrA
LKGQSMNCRDKEKDFPVILKNIESICARIGGECDQEVVLFIKSIAELVNRCHCDIGEGKLTIPADAFYRSMLRSLPYEQYLKTSHWQSKRAMCLRRFEEKCAICSSKEELNVHHRTYENLGCESESDLTLLCKSCHELFHKNKKLAAK